LKKNAVRRAKAKKRAAAREAKQAADENKENPDLLTGKESE
jgi:hypothetical protein